MSTTKKILLAAVLCCFFAASSMFANTVGGGSCSVTILAGGTANCSGLTYFNTNWGTLTNISITLSNVGGSIVPFATNTSTTQSFSLSNLTATESLTLTGLGGDSLTSPTATSAPPCSMSIAPSTTDQDCGSPTVFGPLSTVSGNFSDFADWSNGTGSAIAGSATMATALASAGGTGGGSGTVSYGPDGSIGGTITVTYTYSTGVPEPSTMLLMGGALMGLGFVARKRKQSKG